MKIAMFANTDWYLYNFRRSLASALRSAGHDVILISPPGEYGEKLTEMGFRWIPAPMKRRSLDPLRELALINWLRRLLNSERVDVMHGFTIKCAVYGSLAARLSGAKARVSAVAGMGYVFTSSDVLARVLRPVVRTLLRLALDGENARLILQNPDDVRLFERARLIDPARVRLISGSGVNCSRFIPHTRQPGPVFRVLLAARLLWDKGLAEYVEAARQLRREGRPIEFLLAGNPDMGNPAAVPGETLQGWTEEGVVQWVGHVDDMPAMFRSVDAVVLPSYREGLPRGLIEAAAAGLPLVTTDVPGCREVVTNEVDGLLVPAQDAKALARAIARLQESAELRVRLGSAAREKAMSQFDENTIIQQTISVYRELLPAG